MMKYGEKVISATNEEKLSVHLAGDLPCARCEATIYEDDIVREVMPNDMRLYIVCKRCADEIVHGVKA